MSFELSLLILLSVAYLVILFSVAWATERGLLPSAVVRHPAIYTLSIGVYASAWAFYGTVGLAYQYGYGFLTYYLGICGAFLLAPVLLNPILRITRTYQLSSLADLFAFRFRSTWAGTLTTIFMLLSMLPLLALQIQAVTDSVQILTHDPRQRPVALGFCLLIVLFAILFGARHISAREKHEGLVIAIAFESLVKLLCLSAVGLYALFVVFEGPSGLELWLSHNQEALKTLHSPLQEGPWRTLLLVFFAAAIVMPHMYHMAFTENLNPRALSAASWGLPLFLLLMSLAIPPILWAGLYLQVPTSAEYYTLGLGVAAGADWLTLVAFIGGISAASGLIIVVTLALSGMVLNHLVLPVYQPSADNNVNIYRWLLWTRRSLIAAIIMASYGFYHLLDSDQPLTNLGITSFVATVQFLPGALSVLYWPQANHRGFICGLIAGMSIWACTMLLVMVTGIDTLHILGLQVTLDSESWHIAAIASLTANIVVFTLVSLFTRRSPDEVSAAEACLVDNVRRPQRMELIARSPQEFAQQMAKPLGNKAAQQEVEQALRDLKLPFDERRPYALRRLRDRLEANLSGLMGPAVAQEMIETFLPFKLARNGYVTEDIHFIENRLEDYHSRLTGLAAELDALRRYHRQTLQDLPMGVCSLAEDNEVLMWNRALQTLTGINAESVIGSRLENLPAPWNELLERFVSDESAHLHKQKLVNRGQTQWLNLHKAAIDEPGNARGGLVLLIEDQTETQMLEEELIHSERLASIGRLAAGVAHEIGNPITGIACLAQNLREESAQAETLEAAEQIIEQTRRVSRIVQSMVNFAHVGSRHNNANDEVDLVACTNEAIHLLSLNRKGPEVNYVNLCDTAHRVAGDSQRLVQVLINLLGNARDASRSGDSVTIHTAADEHQILLMVEDQGSGIEHELKDRLFEPFFTTKEPGAGTGLGLALVYSIIEEHYGQITVDSPIDDVTQRGTRFTITLPRYGVF
ncbi:MULTISPECIES: sensor histidine kinase [Halopseudomonas]|nr:MULTISPECIES: sensor histidine kinase [Halopseudomonas]WGK62084.1 ATP-binding protein [Halopseudomonas sp. SMJS2]SER98218.1 Two-component sensor kinase CbrA [Halopseudomonas bauzanensis]SFM00446.1 PAS domain S-box-containing protein [Halopseudomonas bauzanensis]